MTTGPALYDLLYGGEWKDAEFKAASLELPKLALKTVSAFANTCGGRIVLGIIHKGEHFEVSRVGAPDKVQNDLLSVLHTGGKLPKLRTRDGVTPHVTAEVVRLIGVMEGEMDRNDLMTALGLSDLKHFQAHYQCNSIAQGHIEMTLLGKPCSRAQR